MTDRIHRASDRGVTRLPWLDSRHTFSFGDFLDPARMGFGPLRVLNEDRVAPGEGFGMHGHRDMEILTWVISGALRHRDSLGHGSVIRAGELQRMRAGTGIVHSEMNDAPDAPVHFLQIWISPETQGLEPGYAQAAFPDSALRNRWALAASGDGREGSLGIARDASMRITRLDPGAAAEAIASRGRMAWFQVVRGRIQAGGIPLEAGDGLAVTDPGLRTFTALEASELIAFDLDGGS